MKTRSRPARPEHSHEDMADDVRFEHETASSLADVEDISDEELEALFLEENASNTKGPLNLPTVAGLSLILVGIAYLFQQLGLWSGIDLTRLAQMLPWLAGILIILLGFGVLSWSPDRKRQRLKKKARAARRQKHQKRTESVFGTAARTSSSPNWITEKRRLRKSRNKKIAGVCAGIAEYFNIDPTLVRIAFVIGTIASGGPFLLAYLILAMIMPGPGDPPPLSDEERIRIIRDS